MNELLVEWTAEMSWLGIHGSFIRMF